MTGKLEGRLAKLEIASRPAGFAVHVCDLPQSNHSCRAFDDWVATHRAGLRVMHVNTGVPRARQ
jgi:hypothetical protein